MGGRSLLYIPLGYASPSHFLLCLSKVTPCPDPRTSVPIAALALLILELGTPPSYCRPPVPSTQGHGINR